MNLKNKIIDNLNKLKISYYSQKDKIWQIKALNNAIINIEKYDGEILSGDQLKNNIKGIGPKLDIVNSLKDIEVFADKNLSDKYKAVGKAVKLTSFISKSPCSIIKLKSESDLLYLISNFVELLISTPFTSTL